MPWNSSERIVRTVVVLVERGKNVSISGAAVRYQHRSLLHCCERAWVRAPGGIGFFWGEGWTSLPLMLLVLYLHCHTRTITLYTASVMVVDARLSASTRVRWIRCLIVGILEGGGGWGKGIPRVPD